MLNLKSMIAAEIEKGYNEITAPAKVCQDIVLKAISVGPLQRKITVKGGVVMRSKTGNIRRATQDLDMDFLRYPLTDAAIDDFVTKSSLLKFGVLSTRYKDVIDIYYLGQHVDYKKLQVCLDSYIFRDPQMREHCVADVVKRVRDIFSDRLYVERLTASDKNWIGEDVATITRSIETFLESL